MSTETIQRIVDRCKSGFETAGSDDASVDLLRKCVDELAADCARMLYLQLETPSAAVGGGADLDPGQSSEAKAVLAAIDFGQAAGEHLAKLTGGDAAAAEWDGARMFWAHLCELASNHLLRSGGREGRC